MSFSPSSQLVSFGLSNQMVVTFKEENLMTFKHLFLKDYVDGGMDTYAVYRQADVYDHIDYIIEQVTNANIFLLFPSCQEHQEDMFLFVGLSVYFDHMTHLLLLL